MDIIRLSYAELTNAGDLLNKDLVEKLSGKKVICSKMYNADMIAIGGALIGAQYSNGIRKSLQKMLKLAYGNKPLYVWGSGFWHGDNPNPMYRENLKVCALRGAKSQDKLSNLMNRHYDVPLADAGLLADLFLDSNVEKKYKIGVIPHMFQQNDAPFLKAREEEQYHFIDIKREPRVVINEIAECDFIVSSSLHGLIFADALHIPNIRVEGHTALPGGKYKFEDYYSCYGLTDDPFIINDKLPTEKEIMGRYRIDFRDVDTKKHQLIECFPRF